VQQGRGGSRDRYIKDGRCPVTKKVGSPKGQEGEGKKRLGGLDLQERKMLAKTGEV